MTTVLNNGSVLIEQRGEVVLCMLPGNTITPYATWVIDPDGSTFNGDYCYNIEQAVKSLQNRSGEVR